MSRRDFLKGAAALGMTFTVAGPLLAACGGSEGSSDAADKTLKAAFISNGEVGVGNFEITGYNAFNEMVATYGMESEYAEATPYEQAPEVLTDFANRGFDLIIAHSGGFQSAALQVAPDFPDSWFVWTIDGDSTGGLPNCAIYAFSTNINYVSGAVAGMMTKTNKIGVVGAIPIPGIREEVASFIDGAKYANPKIESAEVIWINSFMDASKAKEAALAMYGRGADVIGHVTDQAAAGLFQAARDTGNWACGECYDEVTTNPDVVLTAGIFNESLSMNDLGKRLTEGTLQPTIYKGGWPEEWIIQGSYNEAIPEDVVAKAEAIKADLISGELVWDPRKVPAS